MLEDSEIGAMDEDDLLRSVQVQHLLDRGKRFVRPIDSDHDFHGFLSS
jgi:hypothetical protein